MDQEYKNLRMYNITKYLNNCYLNKVDPSMDIMKDVDFSEISAKEIKYFVKNYGYHHININESLAINCISNIPYEAYQNFVTLDWLYFEKDYDSNVFRNGLAQKTISLVEKLHDLGLESALNDRQARHGYIRRCLENILNFNYLDKHSAFPITDNDFGKRYLALVKKTASELEFFHKSVFIGEEPTLKYSPNVNWLKMASNVKSSSAPSGVDKNEILEILIQQPQLLPLFEDGLLLVMKHDSKNLKGILGFGEVLLDNEYNRRDRNETTNLLSVAFEHNNIEAGKMIVEALGLSPRECLAAYEGNISREFADLIHKDYDDDKEQPVQLLIKKYFNNSYRKIKANFFPELDTGYLPLFALGKDKKLKQDILNNKEILFEAPISEFRDEFNQKPLVQSQKNHNSTIYDDDDEEIDDENEQNYGVDFSLNDCLFRAKIINKLNDFLSPEGKKLIYPHDRNSLKHMRYDDFLISHILKFEKEFINTADITSITNTYWDTLSTSSGLHHFIDTLKIKHGGDELKIDKNDFELLLNTVKLEVELSRNNTNTSSKNNKLKI
jgi:hypothetical protein